MKVYKLTTQDGRTRPGDYNETQWGEGVEHTAPGGKPGKCGIGWLHAYHSPAMATMMNDVHAQIDDPVCWECDADVAEDLIDKLLCTRIKTIQRVDLPQLLSEQQVNIAIRATMVIYDEPSWMEWAQGWLSSNVDVVERWHSLRYRVPRYAYYQAERPANLATLAARALAGASNDKEISAAKTAMLAVSQSVAEARISGRTLDLYRLIEKVIEQRQ